MPVNHDSDYINELKVALGRYLRNLDIEDIHSVEQGYTLDNDKNVIGLNLNSSKIKDLDRIVLFKNLTHLDLTDNRIDNIKALEKLQNLTHLFLSGNKITTITSLKKLEKLKWLVLKKNPITEYASLAELKNLTHLSLSSNNLTDALFLKNLSELEYLDLSSNRLTNVSFLVNLKKLAYLNLNSNQVSEISCLNELKNLTRLDLRNNNISRLPPNLLNTGMKVSWKEIETDGILLKNNPLKPPPPEIEKKGNHAVSVYLKSLFKDKISINELKVLLVGDGGAGKTTLVKRICGKDIDLEEPATPGVNISDLETLNQGVNISDLETLNQGEQVKIKFWDFGGQVIMHTTHQFFLTRRSLYILVLDGRRDEKPEYWLDHIKTFGGNSPVLVVLNKFDANPNYDVDRKMLEKKYPNIKGFFKLSCTRNDGVPEFIQEFKTVLKDVEMLNTLWPVNWITVKSILEDLKVNYITYEQYRGICRNQNILEKEPQDILLDYLHDLGVMLNFRDINLLNTNVLQPHWVTQGVYKIISSELVKDHNGILKLEWLPQLLLTEPDYPPETHIYFVDLMKKFKLCYGVDQDTLLFPDKLEPKGPDFDFDYDSSIHFFLEYDFLHRSVMTQFQVTMHKDIKKNLRWLTGVVLQNPSFQANAVVRVDYNERRIFIDVNGDKKRDYLLVIRQCLRNINQNYEKIKVTERVYLPEEPGISVSYEHIRNLLKSGHIEVFPEGSIKSYSIIAILEGIEDIIVLNRETNRNPGEISPPSSLNALHIWALYNTINEIRFEAPYYANTKKKIRKIL